MTIYSKAAGHVSNLQYSLTAASVTDCIPEYLLPDWAWYDSVFLWNKKCCCSWFTKGESAMGQPFFCRISACNSLLGESVEQLSYS